MSNPQHQTAVRVAHVVRADGETARRMEPPCDAIHCIQSGTLWLWGRDGGMAPFVSVPGVTIPAAFMGVDWDRSTVTEFTALWLN